MTKWQANFSVAGAETDFIKLDRAKYLFAFAALSVSYPLMEFLRKEGPPDDRPFVTPSLLSRSLCSPLYLLLNIEGRSSTTGRGAIPFLFSLLLLLLEGFLHSQKQKSGAIDGQARGSLIAARHPAS